MPYYKSNIDFFNYGNYNRVKSYFETNYWTYDKGILKKIIQSINANSDQKEKLNPIFEQLKKYATRGHAFYHCSEPECCRYINHWLNIKLIENKHIGLSESIFKIFDEFMDNYKKYKEGAKCVNKLHYIEPEKVRNIKILYELYDRYTDLERRNKTEYNILPCSTYHSLITDYNNFIRNYRKQSINYLNNLLNEFKTKIEGFESISKGGCSKNYEILPPVEPPSLPPKGHPAKEKVDLPQPEETTISEGQELHVSKPQLEPLSVESGDQKAQGTLLEGNLGKTPRDQTLAQSIRETQHTSNFLNSYGTELRGNFVNSLDSNPSYQLMEQLDGDNSSRLPQFPSRDQSAQQRDKDGYYSTITDTITGFISEVQPGPVLGVSGGMGVLFLLFKLDPSLEEEEDDSVKFLEILEDLHQENSQIFMNMMVDLLDMVQ
ncbi:Plasmodium vivax Vir protein, putative [Plasmodium vivax]|uniref:Vir protein, putative n=1 Tax=Plasmodium vivax TaxID=5855 RepID=A0A1G4EDX8_PLAVI|nr:Plasmodium vivax Vir protein, putative [Plasmodium vivax]